jgi:hypothetical protein
VLRGGLVACSRHLESGTRGRRKGGKMAEAKAAIVTGQNWIVDGGMTRRMIYAE